jgi:RIO kinase 1
MSRMPKTYVDDSGRPFDPSFQGSRQERAFVRDALGELFEDHWLTDVLYRVQGGKEATVYCCRAHPSTGRDLLAVKVFRPRIFRAMRNDSHYRLGRGMLDEEGKTVVDGRSRRALRKRTSYGKRLSALSWVRHEHRALREIHAAGGDVPEPLAVAENAILMEFVGDERGPAPLLRSVHLEAHEARDVHARILRTVDVALDLYRVHADLSAYNVMLHDGELRVIDWPQCVDALRHPDAFSLLVRDLDRLGRAFARWGVETDPLGLAMRLWEERIGP